MSFYILLRFLVWKIKKIIFLDIMILYILVWLFFIILFESFRYFSFLSFSIVIVVMILEMLLMGNLEVEVVDNFVEFWLYFVGNI